MTCKYTISVLTLCMSLVFGKSHAMIRNLCPVPLHKNKKESNTSIIKFNDVKEVGKLFVAPAIVSISSRILDVGIHFTTQRFWKRDIIESEACMLIKACTLSLPCYFLGQSHLIPGIFFDEYIRYKNHIALDSHGAENQLDALENVDATDVLENCYAHTKLLAQSFAVLSVSGGVTRLFFDNIIPLTISATDKVFGYPAAKLGFTDNKRFAQEKWGLWWYGLCLWWVDHALEPIGYSFYLQHQQKNESIFIRIAKFMGIFLFVSYVKYGIFYPDHFSRTKLHTGAAHDNRFIEMYENLPLQTWFGIELAAKCLIMQLVTDSVSDVVHDSFLQVFMDQDACRLFLPFLSSIVSMVLFKAYTLPAASPLQENHIMPVHGFGTEMLKTYRKFGLKLGL